MFIVLNLWSDGYMHGLVCSWFDIVGLWYVIGGSWSMGGKGRIEKAIED